MSVTTCLLIDFKTHIFPHFIGLPCGFCILVANILLKNFVLATRPNMPNIYYLQMILFCFFTAQKAIYPCFSATFSNISCQS